MTDFIIIGSVNHLVCQTTFPLFMNRKVFLGYTLRGTGRVVFNIRGVVEEEMGNCCWYNTLKNPEIPPLNLTATYSPERYPKYDNYDAINVDRLSEIPCDYYGTMGVPITFFAKWNPEQFKVLGISATPLLHGRRLYKRVFIRRKKRTDYIVVGNKNAVICEDIFPYIKDNKMWLGYSVPSGFDQPQGDEPKNLAGLTRWFTNLEHSKRKELIGLVKKYNPTDYPKYDNYDAIEVGKVTDIPKDYDGVMGVPITYLDKHNPNQFEIITRASSHSKTPKGLEYENGYINGKWCYSRILIRKIKELPTEEEVKNIAE